MFLPRHPKAQECATPRSPASNRSRFTYTRNLFCRTASVLGRPVDQYHHPLTHETSSVGARPSSAAPVDQNHHPLTHETSSVGPRPSSAAPVEQKFASSNTRKLFSRTASVLGRPRRIEPRSPNTRNLFCRSAVVLGRPRRIEPCQINGVTLQ